MAEVYSWFDACGSGRASSKASQAFKASGKTGDSAALVQYSRLSIVLT